MFYGLDLTFRPYGRQGHRIVKLTTLDGKPIEDNKLYTVSTIDYLLNGGGEYDFSKAVDVKTSYGVLRDIIKDDISEKKTIIPKPVDYVHLKR